MRPVLVAPDSFKGTFSAETVADLIASGLSSAGIEQIDICPVADGGEGTMAVLLSALGGQTVPVRAHDPLGREIECEIGLLADGKTAIVEVAQASGLELLEESERDPEKTTTNGTGELILAAIERGAKQVLVAAGGSATVDGGAGAIQVITAGGGLGKTKLTVLCDTKVTFERAAELFGPQKGASPAAVKRLSKRLARYAQKLDRDPTGVAMSGAAGGLSGGLWAQFRAELVSGAAYVLDAIDFEPRMRAARFIVIGEGRLDRQSLSGKITGEIATRARQAGIPCHAIVGSSQLDRFESRILDLHIIKQVGDEGAIRNASAQIVSDALPAS